MGLLEGKVAIITGSGGGIGREHALLFAREGAKVVVNDLGSDRHGGGKGAEMAEKVVAEIKAAGGDAVANYDSVATREGADGLVWSSLHKFGEFDIVVNNAGILRDAFIAGIEEPQWDSVIAVHLKGHLAVLRHAAGYWKAQSKAGQQRAASVINTASASGTFMANSGQANYGAAKAGIAALTLVAAQELERYGVR